MLWKLRKLLYGITEAGRHCAKENLSWMIDQAVFKRVGGISKLYIKRNDVGKIILMMAVKAKDDILVAGPIPVITEFANDISKR